MPTATNNTSVLCSTAELSVKKTLECGQCFRWNADERGVYTGVAGGHMLRIWEDGSRVLCDAPPQELSFWENYFDLNVDYAAASKLFTEPEYLRSCSLYGAGIRILKQEPWEALCSFIISQCNNIPRIKKIVETLCTMYGDCIGSGLYTFPDPDRIAPLSEKDLAPLKSGYRAQYILSAARAVLDGSIDFQELYELPGEESFAKIKELQGVGSKVANCFMLYGLHKMDRFPIDTWMKKALEFHFPVDFDPRVLGDFAGLAQQYIFYYIRTEKD